MGKYGKLAEFIVEKVGGKENIKSLTHCITRLRFQLADEGKADDNALKGSDGIVTVMKSGGQYQVVIGNHVADVYADVCIAAGITEENASDAGDTQKGLFNRLIDIISGCFQPVLGALCAAGIVKGLNAVLLLLLGQSYGAGGTYLILNAIGDSVFYFFPVILGYSAARKFNVQPVIGILLGAVMCYPSIQKSTLEAAGEALGTLPMIGDYYTNFIGIPFVAGNYTSSVVPILVVTAFAIYSADCQHPGGASGDRAGGISHHRFPVSDLHQPVQLFRSPDRGCGRYSVAGTGYLRSALGGHSDLPHEHGFSGL